MRNDIFPTEPCPNVIDPTPDGARAIPRRDESNRADREIARRAPDHNSLRAESRVKEGFDIGFDIPILTTEIFFQNPRIHF